MRSLRSARASRGGADLAGEAAGQEHPDGDGPQQQGREQDGIPQLARDEIRPAGVGADPQLLVAHLEGQVAAEPAFSAGLEFEVAAVPLAGLAPGLVAAGQVVHPQAGHGQQDRLLDRLALLEAAAVPRQGQDPAGVVDHRRAALLPHPQVQGEGGEVRQQEVEGQDADPPILAPPAGGYGQAGLAQGVEAIGRRPERGALRGLGQGAGKPGAAAGIVVTGAPFFPDLEVAVAPVGPLGPPPHVRGGGQAAAPAAAFPQQEDFPAVLVRQQGPSDPPVAAQQGRQGGHEALRIRNVQPAGLAPVPGGLEQQFHALDVPRQFPMDPAGGLLQGPFRQGAHRRQNHQAVKGHPEDQPAGQDGQGEAPPQAGAEGGGGVPRGLAAGLKGHGRAIPRGAPRLEWRGRCCRDGPV